MGKKHHRNLAKLGARYGYTLDRTSVGGHITLIHNKTGRRVKCASTPTNPKHALNSAERQLKRIEGGYYDET